MRMSIGLHLAIGFGILMVLSLGLSLFQLSNFKTAMTFLETVTQRDLAAYRITVRISHGRAILWTMRANVLLAAALPDGQPRNSAELRQQNAEVVRRELGQYRTAVEQVVADMAALAQFSEERSRDTGSESRRPLWIEMNRQSQRMIQLERLILGKAELMFNHLERGLLTDAAEVNASIGADSAMLDDAQQQVEDLIAKLADVGRSDVRSAFAGTLRVALVAIFAMVLAAATAAWAISTSIGLVLRRFMGFVQRVGQGELTHVLPAEGRGELARMGAHLNGMREALRNVAIRTRAAAEDVNASTAQIRASAQEQAAAAAQQLSAIEQTTATLTEITQSGAQITRRAQEVEGNAHEAAGLSDQGLAAVVGTVAAMNSIREQVENLANTIVRLSERTQAIGEIILTVNTIAERSHLLALNAAIEAAAAGEHGRTFAVVAGEIKRLADQARDATGQVRDNLGEIQQGIASSATMAEEAAKRAEAGRVQTEDTDRTIRGLAEAIQESVQAFQQIVAATNQHQIGLEQVMQALASVRQAASQTTATTRELEGAAANMNTLSEGLVDSVGSFRL